MARPALCIVTPALADANNGNWQTAKRWAQMLSGHYRVRLRSAWPDGEDADVLLALHARRSAASVAAWAQAHPDRPLVLALTGTDLYKDIHDNADAQRSLELAHRLIVLQAQGVAELPRPLRAKTRVLYQSSTPRQTAVKTRKHLRVVMVGHLRDEKWPQVLWQAVQQIAPNEGIWIDHIGKALDPALGEEATRVAREHPHYRWLGEWPHAATRQHIQRAHVLVHTSRIEGGAHVIMEAVLSGTPVLASRISGNVGMLGEDYPGYFAPGDASALAHLLRLCRQTLADPHSQLAQLQRACEARATLFLPAREQATLLAVVNECLAVR
jgi:putative glycosyltransferase (TIGR04348 family)